MRRHRASSAGAAPSRGGAQRRLFDATTPRQEATHGRQAQRHAAPGHPAPSASGLATRYLHQRGSGKRQPSPPPTFALCQVVIPGVGRQPPIAPLQLRTDASKPLHNLGARVAEEVDRAIAEAGDAEVTRLLHAEWRLCHEGQEVSLARTPVELGMRLGVGNVNILQVDFAQLREYAERGLQAQQRQASVPFPYMPSTASSHDSTSIAVLQGELKEALGHLDVLRWRVDTHAEQLSQEKSARLISEEVQRRLGEHVGATEEEIDSLIAKYTSKAPFSP